MIRKALTLLILLSFALLTKADDSRYTDTSALATGKWVKIRVKDEGVYQLTPSSLKSMGFSNPAKVRLYGYNRPVLPETNIQNIEDDLTEIPLYRNTPTGNLLFYSKGTTEWKRTTQMEVFTHRNNPYSSYIYYFLTEEGTDAPAEFTTADAPSTTSEEQDKYYAHTIYEKDNMSFLNCGRTFFEQYDFANGSRKNYTLPLAGMPTSDIRLTANYGAASNVSSSSITVSHDGKDLGNITLGKLTDYQYATVGKKTFTIESAATDKLNITIDHKCSASFSGHLDYILACYETNLSLTSDNFVAFTPKTPGNKTFSIQANGNSNIVVWNVTSPSKTCELPGSVSDKKYNAAATATKISDLYVALDKTATYPTPEKVGEVKNQNLHALKDINLLIIVPANGKLTAQAQRLADIHKEHDGMKCAVVSADQIYNEFSSGTPDITAYRRLAKMLYDRDNSLQNILLFGACYWDNRFVTTGLTSKEQDDYLLVWESENSWSHTDSYTCEEYITLLDDGEGVSPLKEKPDAGVGRIPVANETEAKQVVDKLISYIKNEEAGGWKNTICMMGDDGNANIHMEDAETVLKSTEKLYPNFRYKRIYWDSYALKQSATGNSYPDAINEINRTMEEGALIMNYTGHGAAYSLSHEQVLRTENFKEWTSPRLPLWFTAACDVCPFDMNTENIAVSALLNPKGAAMGFVSTARTVYSSPNRIINRYFMKHVLGTSESGERYTIGEALALAKCDIIESRVSMSKLDSINKAHYVLMGDPAIRLLTPKYNVKIDNISGEKHEDGYTVLNAGTNVAITGHIVDEDGKQVDGYNGIIYPMIFDSEELVKCYNNDASADTVFTFMDCRRTVYNGTDSIRGGSFSFSFTVPLDLNYNDANGMMKLYAINTEKSLEAHGTYAKFHLGSSAGELPIDTIGPSVIAWLNNKSFHNGMHTGTSPVLYLMIADSTGINTTGNGIGHDIEVIIDGKESTTYSLNNYFTQTVGDYTSGSVVFTIPKLDPGKHTLTVRAFDVLNNPGTATISFVAVDGDETIETFDASGRKLNSAHTTALIPGVYIRRYTVRKDNEIIEERTEKFIVTQ